MRTMTLAHSVILGFVLAVPAQAQNQLTVPEEAPLQSQPQPEIQSRPEAQPQSQPAQAVSPSVQEQAVTAPEPSLAPKIQDQAKGKTAQLAPPPAATRFSFDRVTEGIVRLDSQTGQIAYCTARPSGWSCETVPEDGAALEREIGRLRDEVGRQQGEIAKLKEEVAGLRVMLPPPVSSPSSPPPASPPPDGGAIKLPTQEELSRARAYVEDKVQDTIQEVWRRLVETIAGIHKDMLRKS